MSLRDDLLALVDAYCVKHGTSRTALGELVMNDKKFFNDVAAGKRGFTSRTYERVTEALAKPLDDLRREAEAA